MKIGRITILGLILALTYFGCDDTVTIDDIDKKTFPTTNVSYNQDVHQILNTKCANTGCHSSEDAMGGLVLTTYQGTTNDFLVVNPENPDNSLLVTYTHASPLQWPLTDNQLACVKAWIKEGAKNN